MNNGTIDLVWIVYKECDQALPYNYYVAISTTEGVNYRSRGLNSLDSVDIQLKRFIEGSTVSLNGLQPCDSTGYVAYG